MAKNVPIGGGSTFVVSGNEFLLSDHYACVNVLIASAARDGTSTTLRKGLVLGKITASGKYAQYDDAAVDGTETAVGILLENVNLLDEGGAAQDAAGVLVVHGIVDNSKLYGIDANGRGDMSQILFFNVS